MQEITYKLQIFRDNEWINIFVGRKPEYSSPGKILSAAKTSNNHLLQYLNLPKRMVKITKTVVEEVIDYDCSVFENI